MNHVLEDLRRGDPRVFDRLADGELGPADERALLAALDDEPGAWRRCALALLEAQAWRRELGPEPAVRGKQDRATDDGTVAAADAAVDRRERAVTSSRSGAGSYSEPLWAAAA